MLHEVETKGLTDDDRLHMIWLEHASLGKPADIPLRDREICEHLVPITLRHIRLLNANTPIGDRSERYIHHILLRYYILIIRHSKTEDQLEVCSLYGIVSTIVAFLVGMTIGWYIT